MFTTVIKVLLSFVNYNAGQERDRAITSRRWVAQEVDRYVWQCPGSNELYAMKLYHFRLASGH